MATRPFDAAAALNGPLPPPPQRKARCSFVVPQSRRDILSRLGAVLARSKDPGNPKFRGELLVVPRTGNQGTTNNTLWRSLMPKKEGERKDDGIHFHRLEEAPQELRCLANAPDWATCYRFTTARKSNFGRPTPYRPISLVDFHTGSK